MTITSFFKKNGSVSASFLFIFVFSIQFTVNVQYKFLPMTGFKPWTSGIGSDCSTNWATTTAHYFFLFLSSVSLLLSVPSLPTYSTYLPILPTYLPSLLTFVSAYCQNRPLITSYIHYRLFKMCCNKIIDDRKSLMTVLFEGLLNNWQNLKTIMVKV